MEFVNINGKPIDVTAIEPAKKRATRSAADQYHKGWRVVGYSPEQIEAGRAAYERDGTESRTGRPFSVDEFMVTHRPKAVRSKPYEVFSSAQQCKEMAERGGWIGVRLDVVAKGR